MRRRNPNLGGWFVAALLLAALLLMAALYAVIVPARAGPPQSGYPLIQDAVAPRVAGQAPPAGSTTDLQGKLLSCIGSSTTLKTSAPTPDTTAPFSQTFTLQPGWNAIYLELAPQPNGIADALAGLPVGCVFSYRGEPDRAPRAYHPGSAADTNLYALEANQAYLVKLEGSASVRWTIYGRPALRAAAWAPDWNELGLPVDPAYPTTFAAFFAGSPAHKDLSVKGLEPSGSWVDARPEVDNIGAGRAYRIKSAGRSSYAGLLAVVLDQGSELNFGRTLVERSLTIRNTGPYTRPVTVRQLASLVPVPILYRVSDPQTARALWKPLTGSLTLPGDIISGTVRTALAPGESIELRLAVRRAGLPAGVDLAESVLEIGDAAGTRALVAVSVQPQVPVTAATAGPGAGAPAAGSAQPEAAAPGAPAAGSAQPQAAAPGAPAAGSAQPEAAAPGAPAAGSAQPEAAAAPAAASVQGSPDPLAGLWIGSVSVNQVSVPNTAAPDLYFDLEMALTSKRVVTGTQVIGGRPVVSETVDTVRDVVVPAGSTWQHLVGPAVPTGWTGAGFAESTGWVSGTAALGFGPKALATRVTLPASGVLYLRQPFAMPEPLELGDAGLELRLRRDDGAIVYLNGAEILRSNMPSTGVASGPPARVTADGETGFQVYSTAEGGAGAFSRDPVALLVPGKNVLAVEVHQYRGEQGQTATNGAVLAPTASEFQFRVLIHVDASGQARLLKEALLMRDPVSLGEVLLSDSALAGPFTGSGLRDGQAVGRRTSSAAYDFKGDDPDIPGTLRMTGRVADGGTVAVTLEIATDLPTNPFLHLYHPDHDNLDSATGLPLAGEAEVYAVTRKISLTFARAQDAGGSDPGWGDTLLGGRYDEELTGLHREPLWVQGTFTLLRASNVATLDPQPAQAK